MGEGDRDVGEDDGGVGVDHGDDDGLGGVPAPPGESSPSSSSLTFSLDGTRVSPLVHGLHGKGGARAPRDWIYLSLFLRSKFCPFTVS